MTTASAATTMIVVVNDQEFSVPADTPIEDLRTHLAASFPEVATASVETGSRTIDGATYKTIKFVKRAGTKGATSLAPLLAELPPLRIGAPPRHTQQVLQRLKAKQLTIGEALHEQLPLIIANMPVDTLRVSGATLCAQLDLLLPVAGDDISAW